MVIGNLASIRSLIHRNALLASISITLALSTTAYATEPMAQVSFYGWSEGCQAWGKPNAMVSEACHTGPGNSGVQRDSLDWYYCQFPYLNATAHQFLHFQGSNSFDSKTGAGVSTSRFRIARIDTLVGNNYPGGVIYPTGGLKHSVSLRLQATPSGDESFTFLIYSKMNHLFPAGMTLNGVWTNLWHGGVKEVIHISAPAADQQATGTLSTLEISHHRNLHWTSPEQNADESRVIDYRVVSPEYCTLDERVSLPQLPSAPYENGEQLAQQLKAFACQELVPGPRTEDRVSWSTRWQTISPRLAALEAVVALPNIQPGTLEAIVQKIAVIKLKRFYGWASQNFSAELAKQASLNESLAKYLDDANAPFSFVNLLEQLKALLSDAAARDQLAAETLEKVKDLQTWSDSPELQIYVATLEGQLSQPSLIDASGLDAAILKTRTTAKELRATAALLRAERNEYEAKK